MNRSLVSIVIASFNSDRTLRAALQSVVEQTFQDWECIVVDGASTDNTLAIIEEYEKIDSRIRHISEPDNGIYDAFNKGWKLAKGEWIHYLGSDDKLTKESFCDMMSYDNSLYSVISGSVYVEKIDGSLKLLVSTGWEGCHQGKLTRRSAIEQYNGFNEKYRIVADYDLYQRFIIAGLKVKNYDSVVAYFASTGVSQSFKSFFQKYRELRCVDKDNRNRRHFYRMIYFFKGISSLLYRKIMELLKK